MLLRTTGLTIPRQPYAILKLAVIPALAVLLIGSVGVSRAIANQVVELTLQERIDMSSLIVTAEAVSTKDLQEDMIAKRFATMRVLATIKGKSGSQIRVLVRNGMAEYDPDCCIAGKKYLLFLKAVGNDTFSLVNARYGVYEIHN